MIPPIPPSWKSVIGAETEKPYFKTLEEFVEAEQKAHDVFPPAGDVFNALKYTPYDKVNVVLLGQDPYPTPGHAHGLCFSVRPGVKAPASLANIFKELQSDVGLPVPKAGCGTLDSWAKQGVLLLNTVLTVRSGEPMSHRGKGWETFTDEVIRKVNEKSDPVVFVLWGKPAQTKRKLVDESRHAVVIAAHPSPLSAKTGFFGSKTFSKVNEALRRFGKPAIDWTVGGA